MGDRSPHVGARLGGFTTTIFDEMSALAAATGSINLGQGFPDTDGPPELVAAAVAAIESGHNQYQPGAGVPGLRSAVSGHQRAFYGLEYDPETEVLVTTGATEAIAASLLALCGEGDEVVMFEPFYDSYSACTALAGGRPAVVPLRAPDWSFDPDQLEAAVTARTRVMLVNSPHNPTGKVFDRVELAAIARCCVDHDLVAVTDEVYEHLVFEGEHLPLATFEGMRERTISISSAGKTFSFTGWKVGWACAPAPLLAAVRSVKQFLTYASGGPFQYAVAEGLGRGTGTSRASPVPCVRPVTCSAPGWRIWAWRCTARRPRTSSPPTSPRSTMMTPWPSAWACRRAVVSSPCPSRRSSPTPPRRAPGPSSGGPTRSGPRC